jgi:hypothetical protein
VEHHRADSLVCAVLFFAIATVAACGGDDATGDQTAGATRLAGQVERLEGTATSLAGAIATSRAPTTTAVATAVPTIPPPTAVSTLPPPTATPRPAPTATTKPLPTATPPLPGVITLATLDGAAALVGDDGQYLGVLSSNRYDSKSVCNPYGDYGSKYSSSSVRNPYGDYGSKYGSLAAYNSYTSTPPAIVYRQRVVGYLTKNKFLSGAIDPDILFATWGCTN